MRSILVLICVFVHTKQSLIIEPIQLLKNHSIKNETTAIESVNTRNENSSAHLDQSIREIEAFLQTNLKKKVLEFTVKPLTKPGDNFKSLVQAVDVKLAGANDSTVLTKISFLGILFLLFDTFADRRALFGVQIHARQCSQSI